MSHHHTVRSYDQQLSTLKSWTQDLGHLIIDQFDRVLALLPLQGLGQSLTNHITPIIDCDKSINHLEQKITNFSIEILALRHPLGDDLRLILGTQRLVSDLERLGDHLEHFATQLARTTHHEFAFLPLQNLLISNKENLKDMLLAYRHQDCQSAQEIWHKDTHIDALYADLVDTLFTELKTHAEDATDLTHILFMAKNLERVGDYISNGAEAIYFIETGLLQGIRTWVANEDDA
jgi:phosphate transport system protein